MNRARSFQIILSSFYNSTKWRRTGVLYIFILLNTMIHSRINIYKLFSFMREWTMPSYSPMITGMSGNSPSTTRMICSYFIGFSLIFLSLGVLLNEEHPTRRSLEIHESFPREIRDERQQSTLCTTNLIKATPLSFPPVGAEQQVPLNSIQLPLVHIS